MKKLLISLIVLLYSQTFLFGQIISTTTGGRWDDSTTWVGGVIPTATDDVIINGTVKANSTGFYGITLECNNLTINTGDSLYCDDFGSYGVLLFVNGNLVNNGSISQSDLYWNFGLSIKGDIINNGTFMNKYLKLEGTSVQTISSTEPIRVGSIEISNGQNIIAGSDLSFVDTYFQFNHGDFIIESGKTVSFLSSEGGYGNGNGHIDKAHIKGGGIISSSSSNPSSNVYWFNDSTTVENITLTGCIRGKGDFTILGNVVNKDTLQQAEHNYSVSIRVKEDFTNDGVVQNNPFDNDYLYMDIEKNVINNGSWINSYTVMDGTSDQTFTNKGRLASYFELNANVNSATTFQWYKDNTAIEGANDEKYTIYDTTAVYGEYYCQTNSGNSRKITIIKENSGGGEGGVILTENFDGTVFPPNGWSQEIQNTSNTWRQGNPQDNSFTDIDPTNVYSAVCPWVAQDQNEWLNTPIVSLPDAAIQLDFYCGFSTNYLTNATLKLHISTDGGTNWAKVWEANNDGNPWQWRNISVNLSAYKNNSNVILGWQYIGNDGDLVGIDNVKLIYGTVGVKDNNNEIPDKYLLNQNYPNPFNPATIISYQLPKQSLVLINIYNILGQKVAQLVNQVQNAGNYTVRFDASNLSSGIYIYKITAGEFIQSKKMLLLK